MSKSKVGEWIPAAERDPEKDYTAVLVYLECGVYDIAVWHNKYGFRPWYAAYYGEAIPEWKHSVTAWMPLPEPYREVKE